MAIYTVGTLLITLIAAFPLFCKIMRVRFKDLRLLFKLQKGYIDIRDAIPFLILSLGIAALPVIFQAFQIVSDRMYSFTPETSTGIELLILIMQFIVVMPIVEEIMFRGIILNHFRCHGDAVAVAASTLLFAFGHLNLVNTLVSLPIGIILGYAALRTGNIRLSLMIHILVNLFGNIMVPNILGRGSLPAVYIILVFSLLAVITAITVLVVKRGKLFSIQEER